MRGHDGAAGDGMNVLLVEDDPGIGRFVTRGLAGRGYRVAWERSGARTVELLAGGGFAAALLDLGLPDGDGLALCRALRGAQVRTPVLMLTARGALQDRLDGFDAGADDYLPKPFAFDELVARLAAIIRRAEAPVVTPPTFGALTLRPEARTASVDGQPLPLSRREYDLLARLVAGGGATVTRAALSNAVWGDAPVSDNSLDVYVGYLRRRLYEHPAAPRIATARGEGFRLHHPDQGTSQV
ncbi:response regulator transcription factor [Sphingomonas sp. SUN019]|uniref:response regulator transcription factor n=1 Tax=Sphingomonas sp. SUN019 TaxID=2937788 RepID=UPI00216428EC|nr:response regulator transcription factor [Sphingomonas sp. SUN019]UVO49278.1 response regulator transcription factor [Sphingomonas sp. SUN019]